MCNKSHVSTEEALACRDKERKQRENEDADDLIKALQRYARIELALSDLRRYRERAKRENKPEILLDDSVWEHVDRVLKHHE